MKIVEVSIKVSDESYEEFLSYLKSLPVNMILFGLRFAHKRYVAETGDEKIARLHFNFFSRYSRFNNTIGVPGKLR